MMFGSKVVDFIKQQATGLLASASANESAPKVAEQGSDQEGLVLMTSMMGALYMGAGVDGEIDEDEYAALKKMFAEVTEGACVDEEFDALFDKTADLIDEEGFESAIADIAKNVTNPEHRQSVLTIAIAAACAAGDQGDEVEEDKQVFVHQMADAFGITQAQLEAYYTEVDAQTN
jgi:hypothetical protein